MDKDTIKEGDAITDIAGQILHSYEFDSVIILATKRDETGSNCYHGLCGNWFAIYGSVNDWLLRADTNTQNNMENGI